MSVGHVLDHMLDQMILGLVITALQSDLKLLLLCHILALISTKLNHKIAKYMGFS